jgi:hypothetical protein
MIGVDDEGQRRRVLLDPATRNYAMETAVGSSVITLQFYSCQDE